MSGSARKSCLALAAASVLAAACATDSPDPNTAAATASGTPSVTTKSAGQQPPAQRMSPAQAAQATPKGVPAQRSVFFDYDSHDIKPEFRAAIEAHARYLREHAGARVTIEGNGDERGSREYNLALGQRRAESVRQMLRLWGAADQQIEAVSFGEEKPRALGHSEASWAENRRSDFAYTRGE